MTVGAAIDTMTGIMRRSAPSAAQPGSDVLGPKVVRRLRTGKTVLTWRTTVDGAVVVEKTLTSDDPYWVQRFRHEAAIGRLLAARALPFQVPRLLEDRGSTLVFAALPGRALAAQRFPSRLSRSCATLCVELAEEVASIEPSPSMEVDDAEARLAKYADRGWARREDLAAARRLISETATVFSHGDFRASNIIASAGGLGLVDWEFAGLRIVGYDLATLWTQLALVPRARERVVLAVSRLEPRPYRSFWLAAYLVTMHEGFIHQRDVPSSPLLAVIARMHTEARTRMREVAG